MMRIGFIVSISCFALLSFLHLVFCFMEKEKERRITKPFLMLTLAFSMFFLAPEFPLLPLSVLFCMVGDIFMLFKHRMSLFSLGALMFALSHSLNFVLVLRSLSYSFPWYGYLILALVFFLLVILGYFVYGKKKYGMVVFGFSFFHLSMLFSSLLLMLDGKVLYGALLLSGYLLCIFSDLFLDYTTHKKDVRRRDFYIMLSYLSGEILIFFSIAFLSLSSLV